MRPRAATSTVLALAAALVLASCARVRPHERRHLASDVMDLDADGAEIELREHYLQLREGSAGGRGRGSVGCGCG